MKARIAFKHSKLGGLGDCLEPHFHETVVKEVRDFIRYAKEKKFPIETTGLDRNSDLILSTKVQVVLFHALDEDQPRYILYAYWFVDLWFYNRNGGNQKVISEEIVTRNTHELMCVDLYLLLSGAPEDWMHKIEESRRTLFLQELWNREFRDTEHIREWLWEYVQYEK